MHWVEFALQGVRGFLPSVRVSLKPGYWTLLPQTPGAPLIGLTSELCFPDGRGGDARYAAGDGITAKDFVYALGFRNPFGGDWRALDGFHYEVENGPNTDRFARVVSGRSAGSSKRDSAARRFCRRDAFTLVMAEEYSLDTLERPSLE